MKDENVKIKQRQTKILKILKNGQTHKNLTKT